jgi:GT2 family glycosyltransferase
MPKVSIIIPSLGRSECLDKCLNSIHAQSYKDYEIIIVTDKGDLPLIRNQGANKAKGEYLTFIDDDVECTESWLEEIVSSMDNLFIGGVSGPAVIRKEYRKNRDLFRFPILKWIYDMIFMEGKQKLPGHFTRWGTFTTGSSDEDCSYEGYVDYLEACNMTFRADIFNEMGGFDGIYKGVGEWEEPDLSFKIRKAGYRLWFNPRAKIYHNPSRTGVFHQRYKESQIRLSNYYTFAERWLQRCWRLETYKWFLRRYYEIKTFK